MYAVINKSGCTERKGNVQLRLDFFLEFNDPRYNDTLIEGKAIPFHSHFIHLDPDFTEEDIKAEMDFHLPNFYKAFQDRWDKVNGGMRHGWATEKRILPLDYSQDTKRIAQCRDKVNKLTELSSKPEPKEGKEYPATAIDIGPGATDREITASPNYTWIDLANPANDTGIIDTFEVWANTNLTGTNKVGTFYGSGITYTNRDGETIGTVEAGAKRTFSGLSIDVVTGDFAGIYWSVGSMEYDYIGQAAGLLCLSGDQFGAGEQTYGPYPDDAISIYGTGSTAITYTKTVSIDALLKATDTKAISLDALLKTIESKTVNLDTLLKVLGISKTVALDIILGTGILIYLDALLKGKADIPINLDLLIQALDKQDISLDALIVARNLESISVDTLLKSEVTATVLLDILLGEIFLGTASVSLDAILFKALPPNRIYTIEIRDGDGDLLAILENAHGISYAQIINSPYPLTFNLPANDSKASNILLANECWLRDNQTDTIIRKFKLQHEMDSRV